MDRRLFESVLKGDISTFLSLVQEDEDINKRTVPGSLNTILHLTARFGHEELASDILKLWPEMVTEDNENLETPLHEACREGRLNIVKLMVETDPWVVHKLNKNNESALYVACERGRVDVVKLLLTYHPWLLMLEVDGSTTSLHVAAAAGHTDIVRELVVARTEFSWKKDSDGYTPLHLSCSKGHLDITREFLKLDPDIFSSVDNEGRTPLHWAAIKGHLDITRELLKWDPDLSSLQDNEGRTPLHWAAIKGRNNIIDEILSASLEPAELRTTFGETILHLAVKNNQYDAVRFLMETLNITKLVNMQDNDGNTILHLATAGKLSTMVIYLLKLGIDVNAINRKGYTALDVVESDATNSGALLILPALQEAGAKRCERLPPMSQDIQPIHDNSTTIPPLRPKNSAPESPFRHHHRSRSHRGKELENEGLRNARKTITVVAVLIATVTFAAGINPPGGFNQATGKCIMGKKASFKVFMVCNIVALFLSLGTVTFLVSIIPFGRKSMVKLLMVTQKVMWISMSFMAAAYIAALWTVMPHGRGMVWVLATLVAVGGGCTLAIFVGLGALSARHWLGKLKWSRKRFKMGNPTEGMLTEERSDESISNSDVDSSDRMGFHLY